jgi:hypothetical protein
VEPITVPVSVDKPDRAVQVAVDEGKSPDGRIKDAITLSIEGIADQWTWLAPGEARAIAAALTQAADELDWQGT